MLVSIHGIADGLEYCWSFLASTGRWSGNDFVITTVLEDGDPPGMGGESQPDQSVGQLENTTPNPRAQNVEMILQQLRALPTLSPIATRLLDLTSDDQADVRDIIRLIESDPALTAKVLGLCRGADKGLGDSITTVDRAVILLGFDAIRNAVLSVEIYDLFSPEDQLTAGDDGPEFPTPTSLAGGNADGEDLHEGQAFDRAGFWLHSLGVAVSSEVLAGLAGKKVACSGSEAFVAGLLHGLGQLALDRLLPRCYARVAEIASRERGNIAEVERSVIGVDHHTVGKRLGEMWGLPFVLQDVMWLYGQPEENLPDLPHRSVIALVSLADAVTRRQHIGASGNHLPATAICEMAAALGISEPALENAIPKINDLVSARADTLGLGKLPVEQMLVHSIARANHALGRINESLAARSRQMARYDQMLRGISDFHQRATPGQSLLAVCGHVVASAARELGQGFYAMLVPAQDGGPWRICQFNNDGHLLRSEPVESVGGDRALKSLADDYQVSVEMMGLLPELSDCLGDAGDIRDIKLLPLRNGWGLSAVLIHDRRLAGGELTQIGLNALSETYASAIASARQHDGARRLGEQLADANRTITETQARLARSQVMASLGEIAAGAAHEMNNPLTVISGRSQVLASQLTNPRDKTMAGQIVEQSHRLSDLITSLHLFAAPPTPRPRKTLVADMIGRVIKEARIRCDSRIPINIHIPQSLPALVMDAKQVGLALMELVVNAMEANPQGFVDVVVQITAAHDGLMILVKDDGDGMDQHALEHAFDPFFSKKPAGRQPGLGLARAQRLMMSQQGDIELTSQANMGTTVTITMPLDAEGAVEETRSQDDHGLNDDDTDEQDTSERAA